MYLSILSVCLFIHPSVQNMAKNAILHGVPQTTFTVLVQIHDIFTQGISTTLTWTCMFYLADSVIGYALLSKIQMDNNYFLTESSSLFFFLPQHPSIHQSSNSF